MKIKLIADCRGTGKKGDIVEVSDALGSRLVCEASATVEEYEQPSPKNKGSVIMSESELEKIEDEHGVTPNED